MDSVDIALLEWRIMKTRIKFRIREHIMDQCAGIPEPDVVRYVHPRRNIVSRRSGSTILKAKGFPGNVAKRSGIDGFVHVVSIQKWRFLSMSGKTCSPERKDGVYITSRHLNNTV